MKDLQLHPNDRRLVMILRALGNPARVLILNELRRLGACPAASLADCLPLSQSTISEHLRRLREAGIITGEADGPPTVYRLNEETMDWLREQLAIAFEPAV